MSFILKGIDLPNYCKAVEVKFYISDIDVYRHTYTELNREVSAVFNGEALDNIIQIPKDHGRLIDSEEILTPIYCIPKTIGLTDKAQMHLTDMIENAPTILEAEEKSNEDNIY